jgi:hypothetical protein
MTKVTTELLERAYEAGYTACKFNVLRAPAMDPDYRALINGFKVGDGANLLADEWFKGYEERNDEDIAALFPEDEYFQAKVKRQAHRSAKHEFAGE